jgi:hypothetical protein
VAEYWTLLARLDSLLHDEKNNEDSQQIRTLTGEVAIAVAHFILARMLQRTLPAGFIAPCLPAKIDKLPSVFEWLAARTTED